MHLRVSRPARLSVVAEAAALPLPVLDHVEGMPRAVAAVNAGYMSEQSRAVTGPLVSSGQMVSMSAKGFDGQRTQRAVVFPSAGGAVFQPLSLSGRLQGPLVDLPLAAVNDLEGAPRGVVLINPLYAGTTPSRVFLAEPAQVAFLKGGRLTPTRSLDTFTVSWGKLALVTTSARWGEALAKAAGKRAAPVLGVRAPKAGGVLNAVEVGARLVLSGRAVAGPCQRAGAWESRPRLAVGTSGPSARGDVHIVSIRGPALTQWNQYDSGATVAEMGVLLARLGVEDAYALDAGASLQVAARASSGGWALQDRPPADTVWQRPVPAAIVVSRG